MNSWVLDGSPTDLRAPGNAVAQLFCGSLSHHCLRYINMRMKVQVNFLFFGSLSSFLSLLLSPSLKYSKENYFKGYSNGLLFLLFMKGFVHFSSITISSFVVCGVHERNHWERSFLFLFLFLIHTRFPS